MEFILKLEQVCKKFERREYNIAEFQISLAILMIPEELAVSFRQLIHESCNRLEEIEFCSLKVDYYKYGLDVSDTLLLEIKKHKR